MSGLVSRFVVPPDHPALPGHFPGRPLLPGVLVLAEILEAVSKAVAAAGLAMPTPLRLPRVKFLAPVLPGDVVDIAIDLQPGAARFVCGVGTTRIAIGTITVKGAGTPSGGAAAASMAAIEPTATE